MLFRLAQSLLRGPRKLIETRLKLKKDLTEFVGQNIKLFSVQSGYNTPIKQDKTLAKMPSNLKVEEALIIEQPSSKLHADRKFYDLSNGSEHRPNYNRENSTSEQPRELFDYIYKNVIGNETTFAAPFGNRQVVYCDYVASGKPLKFIEKFIQEEVLPMYGNTHTTTSVTSLQTTLHRHEARDIIRNATNSSEHDAVIFVGSGSTSAVHKLISVLNIGKIAKTVFVGPFEHHSNILPWKEIGANVIRVKESLEGSLDLECLEEQLKLHHGNGEKLIGSFSAASNVTGILTNVNIVSALLHRYGALACWDYACAGPYMEIDMNPVVPGPDQSFVYKDAIFLSPHKFVGGTDTPGILIAKKRLFVNPIPSGCGGGTVFFVSRETHRYLKEIEMREEGGTPNIVGSIRAGLIFQLKESITSKVIEIREQELCQKAFSSWSDIPELYILGSKVLPRLPIFSFMIKHPASGYLLHHNFVCVLLNDLFGIQSRGGCACAGPYAQDLLGISEPLAQRIEELLAEDRTIDRLHLRRYREYSEREILRPGFSRLNLAYFMPDDEIEFILKAVSMVARQGWKLLPLYLFNPETGEWKHKSHQLFKDRKWLGAISYGSNEFKFNHPKDYTTGPLPQDRLDCLKKAEEIFETASKLAHRQPLPDQSIMFDDESKPIRWFLLPSEAREHLLYGLERKDLPFNNNPPFILTTYPRTTSDNYNSIEIDNNQSEVCRLLSPSAKKKNTNEADIVINNNNVSTRKCRWYSPAKNVFKPFIKAIDEYKMIENGDRVLVCLSGGKDSLSLLHTMHQLQYYLKKQDIVFELGAITVDPKSPAYDPSPLKPYLASLGVPYFYEVQGIIETAANLEECTSICSFCSRMKRGRIYSCARREGYNVLALGQHLDDLVESFMMSIFHNGKLRTMKANYAVKERDLRVIRPFAFVREKNLRSFAEENHLPVIPENCPGCFEAPKERHRTKQFLAQQEILFPRIFSSLLSTMRPLMAINRTGVESGPMSWLQTALHPTMMKDIVTNESEDEE